jgi:hypothetical protein
VPSASVAASQSAAAEGRVTVTVGRLVVGLGGMKMGRRTTTSPLHFNPAAAAGHGLQPATAVETSQSSLEAS